jgi:hypothetical protein
MMRNLINLVSNLFENLSKREAEFEERSVVAAYIKRNKISDNDLMGMSDDEIIKLRADALANRSLYPIPTTDVAYLYHGTAKARLPGIRAEGLVPSVKSRWARSGLTHHSLGRVFFANTVSKADFYARNASRTSFIILRVLSSNLEDAQPDVNEEDGCFFVERIVPPEAIEFWNGKKWSPL